VHANLSPPCLSQSGFEKFVRDRYTLLPDTRERIVATEVTAWWRYPFEHVSQIPSKSFCFTQRYQDVKKVLADTFFGPPDVGVYSPSVQNTLYLMAKEVLNRFPDIASVQLRMPNLHFIPVNLGNKENPGLVKFADDVYLPTDEPHGTWIIQRKEQLQLFWSENGYRCSVLQGICSLPGLCAPGRAIASGSGPFKPELGALLKDLPEL
jgi:urate oxidase